jgi:CO/xanthine dehydrogenase Mo-binding subunit
MPARVSALRGLGAQMNVFAIESFMDELALSAAPIPVAFRLAISGRARARGRAAGGRALRLGRAAGRRRQRHGFAFARYKNLASYCAVAMEVRSTATAARSWCRAWSPAGRLRRGGQSRRHPQPDRGRHRAVAELDDS